MTLPETSVSEQLAAAFSGMPSTLPVAVTSICDAVLTDVAGLVLTMLMCWALWHDRRPVANR